FLAEQKKTREEIRESWKESADKRAKIRLILADIARKENIEPDEHALEHEIGHAKDHFKDADPSFLHAHIAHALRNEMVLQMLETGEAKLPPHEHHNH